MLNGIIVINKPKGMTSADVVYKLRKILRIKKIGHAGTLDPDVSGVLPVAIGQATKLIERLHEQNKQYQGTGRLGQKFDTGDISGHLIEEQKLSQPLSEEIIKAGMHKLTGKIMQIPPMYSAVKINGRKLYEYARAGESIEVPPRQINILQYDLIMPTSFDKGFQDFDFTITCSKGTYVRTLIEQLGEELGLPAVMVNLIRTSSAGYTLQQSVTLEEVEKNVEIPEKYLQSIESVFEDMVKYELSDHEYERVKNGAKIMIDLNASEVALVYRDKIIAIYKPDKDNIYRAKLMLLNNK